jgi:hypothetical protein
MCFKSDKCVLQRYRRKPLIARQTLSRSAIIFFMCGRYRLSRRKQIIEEHLDTVSGEDEWNPRYNIAPTQSVPIIRQNPKEPIRELSLVRWGFQRIEDENSLDCR